MEEPLFVAERNDYIASTARVADGQLARKPDLLDRALESGVGA